MSLNSREGAESQDRMPFAEASNLLLHALVLQARALSAAEFVGVVLEAGEHDSMTQPVWSTSLDLALAHPTASRELVSSLSAAGAAPATLPLAFGPEAYGTLVLAFATAGPGSAEPDTGLCRLLAGRVSSALALTGIARAFAPERPQEPWLETLWDQHAEGLLLVDASGSTRFQSSALSALAIEVEGNAIQSALTGGESTLRLSCALGAAPHARHVVRQSTTPVRTNGQITGALALFQDLPVRGGVQERTAVARHDLRQPLNVITMAVDMARRKGVDALSQEQRRALERIAAAAARLDGLIDKAFSG